LNTLDNWQHCLLDIRSSHTIKGMKTKQPSVIFTMLLLQKRSATDDIVEKKKSLLGYTIPSSPLSHFREIEAYQG
jgi:hypothetical protein